MADQSLRRADELLTELVEQVETARSMPMSSSCVLPRERLLDLLDELREVLPPEIEEARRVIANRDGLLHDAYAEASAVREKAAAEADAMTANATTRAADIVHDAEVRAYETVERGKAEHATLVSATTIHQSAARAAADLSAQADSYARGLHDEAEQYRQSTMAEADRYAADVRAGAERYAGKLAADSEDYADRTLYELASTLQRAASTADQGRVALAQRRSGHAGQAAEPAGEQPGDLDGDGAEPEQVFDVESGTQAPDAGPDDPGGQDDGDPEVRRADGVGAAGPTAQEHADVRPHAGADTVTA